MIDDQVEIDQVQEKYTIKSLESKTHKCVQPEVCKIQMDYQQLQDASSRWQTRSELTIHDDQYYEGNEFGKKLEKKPGKLSNDLHTKCPAGPNTHRYPPPWLSAMECQDPPPLHPCTNVFYRMPSQRGTRVATIAGPGCTLDKFCEFIVHSEGLNLNDFIVASGTKVFRPRSCNLQSINLQNNSHIDILIPLLGGKGGFGSLLRAIGAQIEKTTNRDACRDLSGRRLRDIKREEELRKLLALQEKLLEERKRRRKEKIEKLKRNQEASSTGSSIQQLIIMFDDQQYNERRLDMSDIIDAAIDKGIINFKKRQLNENADEPEDDAIKKPKLEIEGDHSEGTDPSPVSSNRLIKSDLAKRGSKIKKNDLWLGLEEDDI